MRQGHPLCRWASNPVPTDTDHRKKLDMADMVATDRLEILVVLLRRRLPIAETTR